MDTLLAELKKLKQEKGAIAAQFKFLDKSSPAFAEQRSLMQAISTKIDALEDSIKHHKQTQLEETNVTTEQSHPFAEALATQSLDSAVTVKLLSLADMDALYAFLALQTLLPSQTLAWQDAIKTAFDHQSYWIGAFDGQDVIQGALGITVIDSPLFGRYGVSVPFLNYGGVISRYKDVQHHIMDFLPSLLGSLQLTHIEVRSIEDNLWPVVSTKKVGMLLSLPSSPDALDKALGAKVRAQCKKADEWNPEIRVGETELLADFYTVFSINMRDLGTPVYSKRWFEVILNHPHIDAQIIVVYQNNKPVSAGFLVKHGNLMEIPWASTLRSANRLNANMAMYRHILDYAIASGCRYFDFGRSTQGAGTYNFKRQWGAQPMQHYWYTVLPEGTPPPDLNPDNPKMKLLIALWRRLPVWVANQIGPWIIKGLP